MGVGAPTYVEHAGTRRQVWGDNHVLWFALGFVHCLLSRRFLTGLGFDNGGIETAAIARALVAGRGFADPYTPMFTGPTAHLPPFYPLLIAAVMKLTKPFPEAYFYHAMNLLNAVAFGFTVIAAVQFARRLQRSAESAFVGFLLVALPIVQVLAGWEVGFVACFLVLFCSYSLDPKAKPWLLGLLAAAVALLNVPSAVFAAIWSFGLVWVKRWGWPILLRVGAVSILLCLPWMLRNQIRVGSFCLRDNFGLELQISNNDYACPQFHDNVLSSFPRYHPNVSAVEAAKVRALGEVAYNRSKTEQTVAWMRSHPVHFLQLTLLRTAAFWFPDSREHVFSQCVWIVTLLSIPGMIWSLRRRDEQTVLTVALLAYSLPYLLVESALRYRTPVIWVSAFFAVETMRQAAIWWTERVRAGRLASDMLGD